MEAAMHPDFFNDDAFSLVSLTAVINNEGYVPGRAGELAFAGVGEGIATTQVSVEISNETLTLIPFSARGGPTPINEEDKNQVRILPIPHIKLEETLQASALQNVRELGSMSQLRGARSVIDKEIRKHNRRHDLTLESIRLGALQGLIVDETDNTVFANLYTLLGVTAEDPIDFSDVFEANPTEETLTTVRTRAQEIIRLMKRNLKMNAPTGWRPWALVGDEFFDKLIESTSVKGVWDGWAAAERRLGGNYAHSVYEFAGIMWENYQGTDDNSTVAIPTDEARFFPVGIPGLYEEYYAPADFWDTANTIGLPRYARIAPADKFNRGIALHTQANPLPICLRPKALLRGTSGGTFA
jgi:hypothetical protein